MRLFESIPYEVLKKEKNIEIRKYQNVLLASTETPINKNSDSGFMNVFRYISGDNKASQKISMTTPVVTYENNDRLITGFYVPKKYDKDTVPQPNSNHVFINEMNESIYVVIKFRGSWKKAHLDEKEKDLTAYLETTDYMITSSRYVFRYQPPFVPGIFRHNEIVFKVTKSI